MSFHGWVKGVGEDEKFHLDEKIVRFAKEENKYYIYSFFFKLNS